jgi:hypothetical protein
MVTGVGDLLTGGGGGFWQPAKHNSDSQKDRFRAVVTRITAKISVTVGDGGSVILQPSVWLISSLKVKVDVR